MNLFNAILIGLKEVWAHKFRSLLTYFSLPDARHVAGAMGASALLALAVWFAEGGGAVLFASSDLPEVLGVADRMVVMREGAVAGVVARGQASPDALLRLALPQSTPVTEPIPA